MKRACWNNFIIFCQTFLKIIRGRRVLSRLHLLHFGFSVFLCSLFHSLSLSLSISLSLSPSLPLPLSFYLSLSLSLFFNSARCSYKGFLILNFYKIVLKVYRIYRISKSRISKEKKKIGYPTSTMRILLIFVQNIAAFLFSLIQKKKKKYLSE